MPIKSNKNNFDDMPIKSNKNMDEFPARNNYKKPLEEAN